MAGVGVGDGVVTVGDGEAGLGVVAVGDGLALPLDVSVVHEVMPNNRAVVSTNPRTFIWSSFVEVYAARGFVEFLFSVLYALRRRFVSEFSVETKGFS